MSKIDNEAAAKAAQEAANKQALDDGIDAMVKDDSLWKNHLILKEAREAHVRKWLTGKISTMAGIIGKQPHIVNEKRLAFEIRAKALRKFLPEEEKEIYTSTEPIQIVSDEKSLQNQINALDTLLAKATPPKTSGRLFNERGVLENKLRNVRGLRDGSVTLEDLHADFRKPYDEKVQAYAATDLLFSRLTQQEQDDLIEKIIMYHAEERKAERQAELRYGPQTAKDNEDLKKEFDEERMRACTNKSSTPSVLWQFALTVGRENIKIKAQINEIYSIRSIEQAENDAMEFPLLHAKWNALIQAGADPASNELSDLRKRIINVGGRNFGAPFEELRKSFSGITEKEFFDY